MGAAMRDRPRLVPVLLAVAAFPLLSVAARFALPRGRVPGPLGRELVAELALLILTVAIVAWARWWRQTGLVGPWRHRWWALLPAGLVLLNLLLGLPGLFARGDPALLPRVVPLVAMIGFCEETLTRGVMLYGLSRYGPLVAGLVSSAIFGLLHASGLFSGLPVSFVVVQVITAALLGLLFAGLRLRMLALWPMIVAHALFDVPALVQGYPMHVAPIGLFAGFFSIWLMLPFGMTGLGLLLWEQLKPGAKRAGSREPALLTPLC
jgi:membrane protease YdiL (CAAX protease family)